MFRKLLIVSALMAASASISLTTDVLVTSARAAPVPQKPDRYVVFFAPGTAHLTAEAQEIVRKAAEAAQERTTTRIEIALPPAIAGGADMVDGRYTAIQNIFAASGADPTLYGRAVLMKDAIDLRGGNDRAEIRLIVTPDGGSKTQVVRVARSVRQHVSNGAH
jgi:hypothetical protein